MSKKIIWIDGNWMTGSEIKLSIIDRGITLCDGIFETILILDNEPQLLEEHLVRWKRTAKLIGMAIPPDKLFLEPLINESLMKVSLFNGNGVLRLNWSRGDNNSRGINLLNGRSNLTSHRFWFEINEYIPNFQPIKTMISINEKRNANSLLSQCKTFSYIQSILARRESNLAGYDDALLISTNGEMSCGTTANLIIKRNNKWLTPRIESGCLPGIMRQQGLNTGLIKEAKIAEEPEINDQWLLVNSLGCQPITKVNNTNLRQYEKAKDLWRLLLQN